MVGTKTRAPFKYFVVDAFTSSPLKGNPAVVFLLNEEKDTKSLQAMAQEFNLLTCYVTKLTPSKLSKIPRYNLRWFAPASEVKICGHGTIACTHAIFSSTGTIQGNEIEFVTQSGVFSAKRISENGNQINGHELLRNDDFLEYQHKKCLIQLRFPLYPTVALEPIEMKLVPVSLKGPSTLNIMKMSRENDLIVELLSSKHVTDFNPKMDEIKIWPGRGVAITGLAPLGSGFDFFTRLFSPNFGIDEEAKREMVGTKGRAPYKYFVVDAFTSSPLKGNPAVVFLLDEEKDTKCLQAMAQEFNLLTCYVTKLTPSKVSKTPRYKLRWFAPASEVRYFLILRL
ncbi:hypothetical protein BVRB_9g222380 [Beta vulgaris subsp. vulgaris]|nr:hypothetical protein BVRB_9g222380 [Beta vulgaris subsp. vulgaris]